MISKVTSLLFIFTVSSAFYTDLDETIDMDALMKDAVKLRSYIDCYLDKRPCPDKQSAGYKSHIAYMVSNGCQECDDKIKHFVEEFLLNIMVNYPDDMAQLRAKYDPNNKNLSKLAFEVSKF